MPALQVNAGSSPQYDVVVVVKLDRPSRPLMDLLRIIEGFEKKGIGFQSLGESIDTTTFAR
jgi:DNA invertase Pin-like site-specific DNA recombinase